MPNNPQRELNLGVMKAGNDWKNTGRRLKIRDLDPDYEIDGETSEPLTKLKLLTHGHDLIAA
jgi:hypothetical protein